MNIPPYPLPQSRLTNERGFTLVELVVTLAIVAVVTTLAIPSFSETLRQWRRDSATRAVAGSLQLARAEAIKSTRKIMLCPSTDGTTCANQDEWKDGWIMFVDDGDTDQVLDDDERILQVTSGQSGLTSLKSSGGVKFLQFFPNGLMTVLSTSAAATDKTFNFEVKPSGGNSSTPYNKITVSTVGRASVSTVTPP